MGILLTTFLRIISLAVVFGLSEGLRCGGVLLLWVVSCDGSATATRKLGYAAPNGGLRLRKCGFTTC